MHESPSPAPAPVPAALARARRRPGRGAAAVVVLALALLAAACGGDDGGDGASSDTSAPVETTTTVVNTTSLDAVEISVDTSTPPVVAFTPSFVPPERQSRVVVEGTGPALQEGQWARVNFVAVSGADGSELGSSWATGAETLPVSVDQLDQAFVDDLVGLPIGSRLAVAQEDAGMWVILVVDVQGVLPTQASGEEVAPVEGLPTVTVDAEGTPTIAMPAGEPPTTLVAQPLIKGDGPVVEAGQTISVMYVGALWRDGTVFDSSWERGVPVEFGIGTGQVIPGWDEGLVGQTVGSRVLLVIPPDKGYGEQGNAQAGISGTDTLVFVVDILAAS